MHKVLREKKETIDNNFTTFQEFLDSQQYSHNSILRYERIFGQNYVSTGGKETTEVRRSCSLSSHIVIFSSGSLDSWSDIRANS